MSRALIAYYSMGGTTAHVAQSVATGLRFTGWDVDLYNIRDGPPPDPQGYNLLGIGTPTYYFRPPFNMLHFLNALPSLDGMAAFVFVLHGTYPGDAGNIVREILEQKGAKELGYFHCYGADFFLGYLKLGYLFSPDHPTAEELSQAEEFGRMVAGNMLTQTYPKPEKDPSPGFVYRLERFLAGQWLTRQVYSRLFTVSKEACTACGLCMKECPMANILTDSEGRPTWGRNCLLCLTCEMKCPADAITSPVSWPLFRPFLVYNVRHAAGDTALEYVAVTHAHGRTKRL